MLDVVKYYMNDEFDKFLAEFPQDRKNRIDVAKFLIDLKEFAQGKNGVKTMNAHSWNSSICSLEFSCGDVGEYSVLYIHYEIAGSTYRPYTMIFVFGEDDSGVWVEVINMNERVDIVDEKVILSELETSKEIVPNNTTLIPENSKRNIVRRYRLQGDINIIVDNINGALFTVIDMDFAHEVFMKKFPEEKVGLEALYSHKEMYDVFLDCYNRLLMDTGALKPVSVWNLDNHTITLYNAFGYRGRMNFVVLVSGDNDGKLVIESPHHKTVTVNLSGGRYAIYRSGGMQLPELERIFYNIEE